MVANMDSFAKLLSPRQQQILQLLAEGYSQKEVARELRITRQTVKTTLWTLRERLGARNTTHAVYLMLTQSHER